MQGVAGAWDVTKQVLGMAGLAESVFEVVYVFTKWGPDALRPFEAFFFALLAITESLGEFSVLVAVVYLMCCSGKVRLEHEPGKRIEQFGEVVQVLVRDPIHNLADSATSIFSVTGSGLYYRALYLAIVVSGGTPVLLWLSFVPIWWLSGGDDRLLKWGICISMLMLVGLFSAVFFALLCCRHPAKTRFVVFQYVVYYSFNKFVAIYLLFSRGDRLAGDNVGQALRALQVAELMSAMIILWRILSDDHFGRTLSEEGARIWHCIVNRCCCCCRSWCENLSRSDDGEASASVLRNDEENL